MLGILSEKEFRAAAEEGKAALAGHFEDLCARLSKSERGGRRALAALETMMERQEAALGILGRLRAEEPEAAAVMDFAESFLQWAEKAGPSPEISMLGRKLTALLDAFGLSICGRPGEIFDPALHEAIDARHDPAFAENAVLEMLRPGFLSGGALIGCAKVVINRPEKEAEND